MAVPVPTTQNILDARPTVSRPQPGRNPLGVSQEREPSQSNGQPLEVSTILLRGSECAFRCTMCDLWKHTHSVATAPGHIPEQIARAFDTLQADASSQSSLSPWVKLYNASNFFAPRNVPHQDLPAIAQLVQGFERVIVENHPKILNSSIVEFRSMLGGKLEVAMGLETVHPEILPKLNKGMHLKDFSRACEWLLRHDIDVRAFVLLRPPWLEELEAVDWCHRSIAFAEACGVRHVSVVPTRAGNGYLEKLRDKGEFCAPEASSLERVCSNQMERTSRHIVVTPDLWDWKKLRGVCQTCSGERKDQLQTAALTQTPLTTVTHHHCPCSSHTSTPFKPPLES